MDNKINDIENKIRILIVEDDGEINKLLANVLNKEGYIVESVFDGYAAILKFKENIYNLVLLDIMLPVIDGIEVLRIIRQESRVPILIMSAKGDETDRIVGLGIGADDYIIKPFSVAELVARVKSHLRRYMVFNKIENNESTQYNKDNDCNIFTCGEISFNLKSYVAYRRDIVLNLTAKEIELLKLFIMNQNRVFTKGQIFTEVWGEDFIGDDNTVMVHIRRLRLKIEDDPNNPVYIKTIWGIGYKMGD